MERIVPPTLRPPHGFSHGVVVPAGAGLLRIAGQTSADAAGTIRAPGDLVGQFDLALGNVVEVLHHAGCGPVDVASMRIYVTDVPAYRAGLGPLGEAWRRRFGRHFPAITLVGVTELFDADALVEIEAEAVTPRG
jgi:enamine deaminase RidA (YjgF/YER057c/UK114 family)